MGIVLGIVILLLSAFIVTKVIADASKKVDYKLEVDLCRVSNEVNFGLKDKTSNFVGGPQFCHTIDKSDKGRQVPTKNYLPNAVGTNNEIRDMINDCWYMWLEGSRANTFDKYPTSQGCFTCFTFKVKEGADKGVSFSSVSDKLQEPYLVKDTSDQCSNGGGYWKYQCDESKGERAMSFKSNSQVPEIGQVQEQKCCVKPVENECENRGGICSASSLSGAIYSQWSCPRKDQSCYVEQKNMYSYIRYIREHGPRGGDVQFFSSAEGAAKLDFVSGKTYAISFVSPNKIWCMSSDAKEGCLASIGNNYWVPVAVAGGAVVGTVGVVYFGIGVVTTTVISYIGKSALWLVNPIKAPLLKLIGGGSVYYLGDGWLKSAAETLYAPITNEVPNFILVSEVQQAQQIGCAIDYGTNKK